MTAKKATPPAKKAAAPPASKARLHSSGCGARTADPEQRRDLVLCGGCDHWRPSSEFTSTT